MKRALTLIELLVALAMAAVVAAALFLLFPVILGRLGRQAGERLAPAEAGAALERLELDLACALAEPDGSNAGFMLTPVPMGEDRTRLTFLYAQPPDSGNGRNHTIRRVRYATPPLAQTDAYRLIRHNEPVHPPTGVAPPADDTLLDRLRELQLDVFDGDRWTNAWANTNTSLPRAVRIALKPGMDPGASPLQTDVLIPAGAVLSPPGNRP